MYDTAGNVYDANGNTLTKANSAGTTTYGKPGTGKPGETGDRRDVTLSISNMERLTVGNPSEPPVWNL
jgi:hypothetical protein